MDKFRSTFPVAISFVDGELPSASKLTAWARQTRQGMSLIEYAIGDLWNQSGDALLHEIEDARLLIPSIGRYIGPAARLNPNIPKLEDIEYYTHTFANDTIGAHDARLPFPIKPGASHWSWSGTGCPTGTPETNKSDVDATGEWWVNTDTGDLYFHDALPNPIDWTLEYEPVVDGDYSNDSTHNIIPDPLTDPTWAFHSLKVETNPGGGYKIFLPPRGPLTTPLDRGPYNDSTNKQSDPESSERKFWQSDAVDACSVDQTNAEHYRYNLSPLLTVNWSDSSTIPRGFAYLYDPTGTGTIIEGVTLTAGTGGDFNKYTLYATGANLEAYLTGPTGSTIYTDITPSSGHDPSLYPDGGLCLITVGADISASLASLVAQYLNHDHSTPGSMVAGKIKHASLSGLEYQGGTPFLTPSAFTGDDHPMYLERHGYNAGRDKYHNKLMGDLVLASVNSTNDYETMAGSSRAIYLGGPSGFGGLKMFWEYSSNKTILEVDSNSASVRGLQIRDYDSPTHLIDFYLNASGEIFIKDGSNYGILIDNAGNGITINGLDGSCPLKAVTADGLTLRSSDQNYFVASRTKEFSVLLGQGFSSADADTPFAPINASPGAGEAAWTATTTGYLSFYINDLPRNFTLTKLTFFYNGAPAVTGSACTLYKSDISSIGSTPTGISTFLQSGWTMDSAWHSATFESPTRPLDIVFNRSTEALKIVFNYGGGTGGLSFRPWVKLTGTYNTVSPWE